MSSDYNNETLSDASKQLVNPKLVTFGNVLIDNSFSIENNSHILEAYAFDLNSLGECSSEKLSNVLQDAQQSCEFLSTQTGGSALNTSKMLLSLGEKNVVFCGAIGDDSNGKLIQKILDVNVCLQVHPTQPTGTCVCLINKENRCCYANIGASIYFELTFLKNKLPELMQLAPSPLPSIALTPAENLESTIDLSLMPTHIFYIEGFFVTGERFAVCKFICEKLCLHSPRAILASNLSAEYMIENYKEEIKYLAEHSSILFGNVDEFSKLAKIYRMTNIESLIKHLITMPNSLQGKVVVCTRGAESVLYSCGGFKTMNNITLDSQFRDKIEMYLNREYAFDMLPAEQIVDTTGCGDAFVAGFFYAYLRGESINKCVAKGVEVANRKIRNIGGTLMGT